MTGRSQRAAGFLLLACLAGVLLLAFAPIASSLERLSLKLYTFFGVHHAIAPPWVTPEDYSRLLNVAFFVPVGLTLAWWLGDRWGWAMPIAVFLSLAIEVFQRVPEVGRDSTLDDVACNVIGASLGVVVVAVLRSATAPVDASDGDRALGGRDDGGVEPRLVERDAVVPDGLDVPVAAPGCARTASRMSSALGPRRRRAR